MIPGNILENLHHLNLSTIDHPFEKSLYEMDEPQENDHSVQFSLRLHYSGPDKRLAASHIKQNSTSELCIYYYTILVNRLNPWLSKIVYCEILIAF